MSADYTGYLQQPMIVNGKTLMMFLVDDEVGDIEPYKDKKLRIKVSVDKEKRSLDANAYFHVLVDKLRSVLSKDRPFSFAEVKNRLIADYGQIWYIDDRPAVYKTNVPPEVMIEQEEPHTKLFHTSADGAYWYRIYRGSHTYNSTEMYHLIQGTIQECKQLGIETKTPDEIKRLEGICNDALRVNR